jgi:hypothetical protein
LYFNYYTLIKHGGFIVVISYMCAVYYEQVNPLIIFPFSPPLPPVSLFYLVFGGFHYAVFKHIWVAYFSSLFLSKFLHSPSPYHWSSLRPSPSHFYVLLLLSLSLSF